MASPPRVVAAAGTAWQGACARSEDPLPSGEPRELGCWRGGLSAADGRSARRKADGQAVPQGQGSCGPEPGCPRSRRAGCTAASPPAPCAFPTHRGRAARDSPLPAGRRQRHLQDLFGGASVTTGSASPATTAECATAPARRDPSPGGARAPALGAPPRPAP